jgi:hypothetical protein
MPSIFGSVTKSTASFSPSHLRSRSPRVLRISASLKALSRLSIGERWKKGSNLPSGADPTRRVGESGRANSG